MKGSVVTILFLAALTVPCISSAQSQAASSTLEWQYDRPNEQRHAEPDGISTKDKTSLFKVRKEKLIPFKSRRINEASKVRTDKVWDAFRKVAGQPFIDKHIDELIAFDSKDTGILGFVMFMPDTEPTWLTSANEGDGWGIALNISRANMENVKARREFYATLIHEYAHILTLNPEQIDYKVNTAGACKLKDGKYFLKLGKVRDRGCAFKNSYLQTFVNQFWTEKDIQTAAAREPDDGDPYNKDNVDKYVTWYAMQNPAEDLAESFTDFIIMRKPAGNTIKDQKILFFYKYPELVQIRTEMRARIAPQMK